MAAVVLNSSFGSLLCTLSTCHLDLWHLVKVLAKLLEDLALCTLLTLCSACRLLPPSCTLELWLVLPTSSRAQCGVGSTSPVRVGHRFILVESVGELPVWQTLPGVDSVGLFGRFMPIDLSLKIHHVGQPPLQSVPLLSPARLPFRRSLCPSCACWPVQRVVFLSPLFF